MRLIDKIALNRLLSIITSFILSVLKLFAANNNDKSEDKKRRPRWRNK